MAANATAQDIPKVLAKILKGVPDNVQEPLQTLYKDIKFTEDDYECFMLNHPGKFRLDLVPHFKTMLQEQEAKKAQISQKATAAKRERPAVVLDHQARSKVAKVTNLFEIDMRTPDSNRGKTARLREEEALSTFATPDRPSKPVTVTLLKSVNDGNLEGSIAAAATEAQTPTVVDVLGDSSLWTGSRRGTYSWMDETLPERAAARDKRLENIEVRIVKALRDRHPNDDVVEGRVGSPTQAEAIICGRVLCEGLDGRLNERSILLEGSRASANSARVQLNVAECPSVSAFPGQIVGVLGRSGMSGTTFHAREFLPGLPPPTATTSRGQRRPLHTLILAGPFSLRDGLDYTPLEQALEHAVAQKPQVLVILGPFLDANNTKVANGDLTLPGKGDEPCSFEEVYGRYVLPTLERCLAPLRRTSPPTEVLIVPSLDEVLCTHPLPQPPLHVQLAPLLEGQPGGARSLRNLQKAGVRFLPNPAHVRINGVEMSITSADALRPVVQELVLRPQGGKIDEALRTILHQRSLFPVLPRDPVQVSESRAAALDFPDVERTPDVVIFPSAAGTANGVVVDGTVFVNPGTLCRPAAPGSFAELWLGTPKGAGVDEVVPLSKCARVDIQKLS